MSVKEVNGAASGTPTTVTNVRFCTTDSHNPGTSFPMVKPGSGGTNFSFKKTLYLNADTTPSSLINNIKFFTDGSIGWTGVVVEGAAANTYAQATGTEGTTGDDANLTTNIATYTPASPLSLTGSISNPNTGKVSQFLELQVVISDAAGPGILSSETAGFRYDEV